METGIGALVPMACEERRVSARKLQILHVTDA